MTFRVAELESLFTANIDPFEKGAVKVETRRKALVKEPTTVKVDAQVTGAVAGMERVEKASNKIDATTATAKLDADGKAALAGVGNVEKSLAKVDGEKATAKVDADTSGADSKIKELGSKISEVGNSSGEDLAGGIVAALATIPFAGAVIGIGAAIAKSIESGLQVEVRSDRLMATTGLDALTVGKLGRAAGEAYADAWGESIAANMDTAKTAIQGGLLNPAATARDSQAVIESLSGVSDILGEEIPAVSRAAAQLLKTGVAKNAQEAFDIIVKGQQAGLNVSEDWLDTIDEYSTQWRKLGLTGGQVMGLLSQATKAGARDTDIAADALKEFSIRAVDGSTTTAAGFKGIGLSAKTMSEQIAKGGPDAAAALQLTLDKLREVKDPSEQAALAVDLFGTQAEDLGKALYSMDLSNAVDQLGAVDGAAASALATLSGNAASQIESAKNNITVATDGIKGALAAAFGPQIEGWAKSVQENREGLMQLLLDLANGGIDLGRSVVEGVADGSEALGNFISGPLADVTESAGDVAMAIDKMLPGDQHGKETQQSMKDLASSMRGVKDDTSAFADELRTNLITNGLDPMQKRLNDVAVPLVKQAALHDALVRAASDIDAVGYSADGSMISLASMGGAIDLSTTQGQLLNEQLMAVTAAMQQQATAGAAAGQSADELTAATQASRDALIAQLVQLGLTQAQAESLAAAYGAVPADITTKAVLETAEAQARLDGWLKTNDGKQISVSLMLMAGQVRPGISSAQVLAAAGFADGGRIAPMASGGTLTPMAAVGAKVPPNTWRVVGDNMRVSEWYIPQDGSARSRQLAVDAAHAFGILPMAGGGVVNPRSDAGASGGITVHIGSLVTSDATAGVQAMRDELTWAMTVAGLR